MSFFIKLSCIFAIGCTSGLIIEAIFRRFFSKNNPERKWINPGFLYGPWLPLYGMGLCIVYIIALTERNLAFDDWLSKTSLILLMAVSMTTIEYLTGLFSLNVLKVRLWDYSKEKNNLNGLICLRFSIYWAFAGVIYYLFVHRFLVNTLNFAIKNAVIPFVLGIYLGIFAVDVLYSCTSRNKRVKYLG